MESPERPTDAECDTVGRKRFPACFRQNKFVPVIYKDLSGGSRCDYIRPMKLQQSQIWKQDDKYFRIVRLERLAVEYKAMPNLGNKAGTLHQTSKKDFCRLLKGAHRLAPQKAAPTPEK